MNLIHYKIWLTWHKLRNKINYTWKGDVSDSFFHVSLKFDCRYINMKKKDLRTFFSLFTYLYIHDKLHYARNWLLVLSDSENLHLLDLCTHTCSFLSLSAQFYSHFLLQSISLCIKWLLIAQIRTHKQTNAFFLKNLFNLSTLAIGK